MPIAPASALSIGLDFGTTNSVVALSDRPGHARVLPFNLDGHSHATFRTAMCFWMEELDHGHTLRYEAGPWAIERFIDDPFDCRFLQSFKTFAASRSFAETFIHGRKFVFEDLLSSFIEKLRQHAGPDLAELPLHLVAGRPVSFAGSNPDDALAMERYDRGFKRLGFEHIDYVHEPVAAAYFFAQRLTTASTVLVADFGGGTSDFSIIRFEPGAGGLRSYPLAHTGVGVAGDNFDYRILEHAVLPQLGYRSHYKSIDKLLEVPVQFHQRFAQWNQLALMKSPAVLRELREYLRYAIDQEGLGRFITLIENDLGYPLYKAISDCKAALSQGTQAAFEFRARDASYDLHLQATVQRKDFDHWIKPELQQIANCLDDAIKQSGLDTHQIDRVFLTGGTSFVPAVRALFEQRFAAEKIETGEQLESIAYGLALIAASGDAANWCVQPA